YNPGSTVTLTGHNWDADESVHVFVNDDVGQSWSYTTDVNADGSGDFSLQLQLPTSFVATYSVTATGATGSTATTSFTDGNVSFQLATVDNAAPASTHWTVNWKKYNNSTVCNDGTSGISTGSTAYTGNG